MKKPGPFLRDTSPKVYYFLIAIINALRKTVTPYSIYITDSLGGSFKSYFTSSDMSEKISVLKRDLDDESVLTIDVVIQRLLNYPDERYKHRTSKRREVFGGLLAPEKDPLRKEIALFIKRQKRELKFLSGQIEESVFYYYHGLSLLPDAAAEYIKGHDFIDIGAYIGDSAIALEKFDYKKIYSIEISQKSIERYRANLARHGIGKDKYEIIRLSVASSDDLPPYKIPDTGSSGLSVLRKAGKYDEIMVEQKTIDHIVEKYKIAPRFIKVDIEGNGLEFARGAGRTLKKFRPVLSVAIYHNPYEFFEVKPLLESLTDSYIFMIRKLSCGIRNNACHSEVVLIGYPKEILCCVR